MQQVWLELGGRVQGVGFRAFARRRAAELGVRGWVRNRPDGAVEIEAQGAPAALAEFAEAMRRGPAAARVEHVEQRWSEAASRFERFEIVG